jgi:chaperonin GroEL (HSP60 family)
MKAKVEAIASHGINCFVNRQLIYNYPESILAEKGIMTIEHADFEGVERLSLVTGGEIASTFDRPDLVKLGRCELIEEIMIGEDKVDTHILGRVCLFKTLTIADQILRRRRRRGLYCRPPRFYYPNGR